jgi:hypothetical protein
MMKMKTAPLINSYIAVFVDLLGFILILPLLPLSLGGGTLNTVLNSAVTKTVSREETGCTLGISTYLENLTRVIFPSPKFRAWASDLVSAILM